MPNVLYAVQPLPERPGPTVFLAGPTPRDADTPSWRPEAIRLLGEAGFAGTVIVPETSDGEWRQSYDDQVDWECEMRNLADVIAFWVPRDMDGMPALTTNVEFGEDLWSGRMLYGRPDDAPKNRYLDHRWRGRSGRDPFSTLPDLMAAARDVTIHAGLPERVGSAARIPVQAWASKALRLEIGALLEDGGELVGFRVERPVAALSGFAFEQEIVSPACDAGLPFATFHANFTIQHPAHVETRTIRVFNRGKDLETCR